ncbi:MAG TPA: ArsR family transcriptional regulator [Streptosporangiaceae bacterium]|nr:ArsR family transcriptional regulator [Streptosporangiaceae bacterium]
MSGGSSARNEAKTKIRTASAPTAPIRISSRTPAPPPGPLRVPPQRPLNEPAISRHLKVLENAGLISRTRRATARLSHLEAEPLREVTTWLARYQQFWDESHERLDELLLALQGDRKDDDRAEAVTQKGSDDG